MQPQGSNSFTAGDKLDRVLAENIDSPVILFVDDEPLTVCAVRLILEREGYCVLTAENGEEALEVSRSFPGTIVALITDLMMPIMDGFELRDRLRLERPGIQVILISACFDEPPIEGCPFLRKPFQISELRSRLREVLRMSTPD